MSRVAIFTDSASRPGSGRRRGRRASTVVPLLVNFGSETFKAGRRPVTADAFWERMIAPDAPFPTTAASSPGDFKDAYEAAFDGRRRGDRLDPRRGHAVGHDQERPDRARHAAGPRDPRRRLAWAPRWARGSWRGWASSWPPRVVRPRRSPRSLEARTADMRMYVALDTLEYLKKGGRISGAQAAIGTLLSVKPIITVKDGVVETADRVRTRAKARERMIELICERPIERLAILHTIEPGRRGVPRRGPRARAGRARPRGRHRSTSSGRRSGRTSAPAASARSSSTGPDGPLSRLVGNARRDVKGRISRAEGWPARTNACCGKVATTLPTGTIEQARSADARLYSRCR